MEKIVINMLSKADSVDGQGVGSAYLEQVSLVRDGANDLFEVTINSHKKADILHVHSINPEFYQRLRTKKSAKVVYCHFLPETLKGSIKLARFAFSAFKKYVISFYRRADYLVVVNPIFIDALVSYGIDRNKIVYIPNYVSKDNFFEISDTSSVREKYGIKPDEFVVLGCGQVQTRKGVLDFVECARKNPNMSFVWCGGFSFGAITDGYKELKEVVDNPPENVKFLGIIPRTEMNEMYNMANCLFMPSYNELFPMAILEAVNSRKPLVLRNLDLYKVILFDKYLVGENNEDFSDILNRLKNDPSYYKKGQDMSYELSQFYSCEHVLSIWRDFYQKVHNEFQERKDDKEELKAAKCQIKAQKKKVRADKKVLKIKTK